MEPLIDLSIRIHSGENIEETLTRFLETSKVSFTQIWSISDNKAGIKALVLFDLDETLVHCDLKGIQKKLDSSVSISITLPNSTQIKVRRYFGF